jgi:dipeptidyl aminopeptidase/acylaminoacyl peptidase
MIPRLFISLLAVYSATIVYAASDKVNSSPPTIEELFRPASLNQVQLSPDGQYLGAIYADEDDHQHLRTIDLNTGKISDLNGGAANYDIYSFHWLNNERLYFNVSEQKIFALGLFATDRDLSSSVPIDVHDLIKVIGRPRARPQNVLVWVKQSYESALHNDDLIEISTEPSINDNGSRDFMRNMEFSGSVVRSYSPPKQDGVITDLSSDFDGELALCAMYREKHFHLYRYHTDDQSWKEILLDLHAFTPQNMDPDGRHLWITHHDSKEGFVLQQYDLDSGKFEKPIYRDPAYDLADAILIFSHKNRRLVGLTYEQRYTRNIWFDRQFADAQAAVDQKLPNCDNQLVNSDEAEHNFLFHVTGARQPGLYVLFDAQQNTVFQVAETAPWLNGKQLSATQPIAFRTRDGVKLEGYLTLPPGASKTNPPPLVVLPHGGPQVRDRWEFNPEVQFLASRGYAVLQPNYRGSSGYCPEISQDKLFDYRCMHNDITDATHAIQHSGLIDPTRIAIMGGSFGGYLSLAGVAFEPTLYRCAVSVAGVFDWEEQIKEKKWDDQTFAYKYLSDNLGQPGTDRAHFDDISPLTHAAQIHVPVFIAHGTDDKVVSVRQSKRMVSQLEKNNVPHETFFRSYELHGFSRYEDKAEYYHKVDAFLAKYLAPKSVDISPAAVK